MTNAMELATIKVVRNTAIIDLRVAIGATDCATDRLDLAPPLSARRLDPYSLWIGPGHWLLLSRLRSVDSIIATCQDRLQGLLFNAIDYSDGMSIVQVSGPGTRDVLAMGCGMDFRLNKFTVSACCRTFFAQVPTVIVAGDEHRFKLLIDSAQVHYVISWLSNAIETLRCLDTRSLYFA